jgi:hypothetical protein
MEKKVKTYLSATSTITHLTGHHSGLNPSIHAEHTASNQQQLTYGST